MSMRNYPVFAKGLLVEVDEIKPKALKNWAEKCALVDSDELTPQEILLEDGPIEFEKNGRWAIISHKEHFGNDFVGDYNALLPDACLPMWYLEEGDWVLMEIPEYPHLFRAAYEDEKDLISQMKDLYSDWLPENFDYKNHLVTLEGVTWG